MILLFRLPPAIPDLTRNTILTRHEKSDTNPTRIRNGSKSGRHEDDTKKIGLGPGWPGQPDVDPIFLKFKLKWKFEKYVIWEPKVQNKSQRLKTQKLKIEKYGDKLPKAEKARDLKAKNKNWKIDNSITRVTFSNHISREIHPTSLALQLHIIQF